MFNVLFRKTTWLPALACAVFTTVNASAQPLRALDYRASTIAGVIERDEKSARIRVSNEFAPLLVGANEAVKQDLGKLSRGDFIIGEGTIKNDAAVFDAIETVGLKALIGSWQSDDWRIFEFVDFSLLNLYPAPLPHPGFFPHLSHSFSQGQSTNQTTRHLRYVIAPEVGDHWAIFLTDPSGVRIGALSFVTSGIEIRLLHPETGIPSAPISLFRLQKP